MRAIVVFGAPLRLDGRPSPALERRAGYAVGAARAWADAPILCSGAARGDLRSEAEVIGGLLVSAGVDPGRLSLDEDSGDTLQTAVAAARFLRRSDRSTLVVCTEAYHMPRTRMLLGVLGVDSEPGCGPGRPADAPPAYWRRMWVREAAAYPFDLAVARWRLRALRALIDRP